MLRKCALYIQRCTLKYLNLIEYQFSLMKIYASFYSFHWLIISSIPCLSPLNGDKSEIIQYIMQIFVKGFYRWSFTLTIHTFHLLGDSKMKEKCEWYKFLDCKIFVAQVDNNLVFDLNFFKKYYDWICLSKNWPW